jgi:hypothetical protein
VTEVSVEGLGRKGAAIATASGMGFACGDGRQKHKLHPFVLQAEHRLRPKISYFYGNAAAAIGLNGYD